MRDFICGHDSLLKCTTELGLFVLAAIFIIVMIAAAAWPRKKK